MLTTSEISPLASRVGLPISRVMIAASSSRRSAYRSATRVSMALRSLTGVVRHER